jgi:hypothetical protein
MLYISQFINFGHCMMKRHIITKEESMVRVLNIIKTKLVLVAGVLAGAIVGGAATGIVVAAIPDANGQVNACYDNSTQALSVSDSGSCPVDTTPLNWSQNGGPAAYARIYYDEGTSSYILDSDRSKNLTMYTSTTTNDLCFTLDFTPKTISAIPDAGGMATLVSFKDGSGWTNPNAAVCDDLAPGSNADIILSGDINSTLFVSFFQ